MEEKNININGVAYIVTTGTAINPLTGHREHCMMLDDPTGPFCNGSGVVFGLGTSVELIGDDELNLIDRGADTLETWREDTQEEVEESREYWYATQINNDTDWGDGYPDLESALEWLEENPTGRIAIIELGRDPVCIDEIHGAGEIPACADLN